MPCRLIPCVALILMGLTIVPEALSGEPRSDAPASSSTDLREKKPDPEIAAAAKTPDHEPLGDLVIAGGGLRFDNADVWTRFVRLAASYATRLGASAAVRPRIAVFATGSAAPKRTGDRLIAALNSFGADAFLAPVAVHNFPVDYRKAVVDEQVVADITNAHGVFFSGGMQSRIVHALRGDDGQATPVLKAIWHVYREGGVVGGTSAGAAIMSRIMCVDVEKQIPLLERGPLEGRETAPGLGFMRRGWFIDQHFLSRGRIARTLAIMEKFHLPHGLGIDEDTALVVTSSQIEIAGYRGALLVDLSQAGHDNDGPPLNLRNARLTYLDRGDRLDLQTLVVSPGREKLAGEAIDPNGPDFKPYYDEPIVANDILANSTMLDVMRRLMDNRRPEAIGLAYDGAAARSGPTRGFEFRLYRDRDTRAWSTGAFGGEDLTIANIHLDVQPIEVHGPLAHPAGHDEN